MNTLKNREDSTVEQSKSTVTYTDEEKQTIQKVLEDMKNRVGLFRGVYDAKNGHEIFMYGICSVMEYLSYIVGEECWDRFNEEFMDNMRESQEKSEGENTKEME